MGVALTDTLTVDEYNIFSQGNQAYLGSMDIEIGFASKSKQPQTPYDQDDLAKEVVRVSDIRVSVCTMLTIMPRSSKTRYSHLANAFSWISRVYL